MDPKEFGAKLRGKRKECKLSYQELAERCHVNHGYIRQLEAGNKLPSVSLLFIICDVLGTSPNCLDIRRIMLIRNCWNVYIN